jgi:ABC-type lipoprotein export system ATPase subunit
MGETVATTITDLGAEASRQHQVYGAGSLITCDRLVRIYTAPGGIEVQALQGLDLLIGEGELIALVGASGSGKSTLMNILAGLDVPTAGSVKVAGQDLAAMNSRQRLAYRRQTVGFIWQQTTRNLLPYLTSEQNVGLPMRLAGLGKSQRNARAADLIELLGITHCLHRRPDQMSGGEQQRAAIAVALANEPKVLLADEPTGELDSVTAAQVFSALQTANTELGVTVLIVTHDPNVSSVVGRVVAIRDGRTATEIRRQSVQGDDGEMANHAVEYAVLDRAGRLQLPREMTEPLGMHDLVRLEGELDHIGVWPEDRPADKLADRQADGSADREAQ